VATGTPILVDGFTAVQAIKHAKGKPSPSSPPAQPPTPPTPRPNSSENSAIVTRIGHTAVPPRFEIVCYQCGYAFVLQGRLYKPLCPKCHKWLDYTSHTISGNWEGDLNTVGTIRIEAGGTVRSGCLRAMDIVLAGRLLEGNLRAFRRIELLPGAEFSIERLQTRDLCVHAGVTVAASAPLVCRNLEIAGEVHAHVKADGLVIIRSGGVLIGALQSAHLIVEDGGGLLGRINLQAA